MTKLVKAEPIPARHRPSSFVVALLCGASALGWVNPAPAAIPSGAGGQPSAETGASRKVLRVELSDVQGKTFVTGAPLSGRYRTVTSVA